MTYEALDWLRRRILRRRFDLLQLHERAVGDAAELRAEREPDWEDAAAIATTATLLETLSETERQELGRLGDALLRMERVTYGRCAKCSGPIDAERLEAVPQADLCAVCAGR